MNLNCRWAFLVHLIECAVHSELQWIKQNCFYHAGCFSYIYSIQNYTIICRCSGEVFLKCLVQWFAQGNEAEQARRPLLSDHSRPVRNEKCTADNLLWFGWCLNGTINFFCNIARCGKTVAAFYCLTCWRVGYESVIKTVMLFRLVVLEHSMPFFYAHMAGGIMFSGCLSHSRQCNISIMGISSNLAQMSAWTQEWTGEILVIKRSDFRLTVTAMVPHSERRNIPERHWGIFFKFGTNIIFIPEWTDQALVVKG